MIEFLIIAGAGIFFFGLCLVGYVIGVYNSLVGNLQDINTQFSNIKTEYQRRADLFYNLVEATKSYKKFEKSLLAEVTLARSGRLGNTIPESIKKMSKLDGIFGKLFAVFENYPNLKSSEQHNKLMEEVRITEDRVNVARTGFNDEVREYNILVNSFPSNIVAKMFRYNVYEYYLNEPETDKPVRINLE